MMRDELGSGISAANEAAKAAAQGAFTREKQGVRNLAALLQVRLNGFAHG